MRQLRISILLISMSIWIFGCFGPVVHETTTDFPATVLNIVGTPPTSDGRERFREIFCQILDEKTDDQQSVGQCDQYLFRLNDEFFPIAPPKPIPIPKSRYRILIVPGFLNACFSEIALPFEDAIAQIDDHRFKFDTLMVGVRSSSDANAVQLADMIENLDLEEDEKIVFIGHSNGVTDILHFLVLFPETARRVSAVISIAGAINGSRLADRADQIFYHRMANLLLNSCEPGDGGVLYDLRPTVSMSWLANNPLPDSVHYFSIAAFTDRDHINTLLKTGYDLLSIYDSRNDGLLLINDQIIHGGTILGYVNSDHLSVALPLESGNLKISSTIQASWIFPRKELLESALLYLAEILEAD